MSDYNKKGSFKVIKNVGYFCLFLTGVGLGMAWGSYLSTHDGPAPDGATLRFLIGAGIAFVGYILAKLSELAEGYNR